jgi:hypothetical protein
MNEEPPAPYREGLLHKALCIFFMCVIVAGCTFNWFPALKPW